MYRRKSILIIIFIWASCLLFIPLCLSALVLSFRHSEKQPSATPIQPFQPYQKTSNGERKNNKELNSFRLQYFKADEPFWKMKARDEETEVLKASRMHLNTGKSSIAFLTNNSILLSWIN